MVNVIKKIVYDAVRKPLESHISISEAGLEIFPDKIVESYFIGDTYFIFETYDYYQGVRVTCYSIAREHTLCTFFVLPAYGTTAKKPYLSVEIGETFRLDGIELNAYPQWKLQVHNVGIALTAYFLEKIWYKKLAKEELATSKE